MMQALQLVGWNTLNINKVPVPKIQTASEVLIRLKTVGICGSDIHYLKKGKIGHQVVDYPQTLGHEACGIVESIGKDVSHIKVGDLVAIDPAMPCYTCDQCKSGRTHTCLNLSFLGNPGQAPGCLSEFLVMPGQSLYPLTNGNIDHAVLSEPLSIGYYAVKQSRIRMCDSIGILGFGPIGMSVLLSAIQMGVCKSYITDRINHRNQMAMKYGADWSGNPDSEDVVSRIKDQEPKLLDVVFECCGQQDAINQAIDLLKPGGTLVIIGIPEQTEWAFSVDKIRHKEILIMNIRRQNNCVQKVLDLMDCGDLDPSGMITHRFPFMKSMEAFELVAQYKDGVLKAIIDF